MSQNDNPNLNDPGYETVINSLRNVLRGERLSDEAKERLMAAAKPVSVRQTRSILWPALGTAVAAAAITLTVLRMPKPALVVDGLSLPPAQEHFAVQEPVMASNWVSQRLGYSVPAVTISSKARMDEACYGQGWGCYTYTIDGEKYQVFFSDSNDQFLTGNSKILPCGTKVFCCKGTGFQTGKMRFYVKGPSEQVRLQIAAETTALLSDLSRQR